MHSKPFSTVSAGDRFGDIATVSDWHLATAAALFYDAGPNHVNPEHSATNRFGRQIAPGFLTTGIMMGVVGRYFGWSIEAFLEAEVKFLAPVFLDDSISVLWEVRHLDPKESFAGGIADLHGWCWTRKSDRLAVDMLAKIALSNTQAPLLHEPPAAQAMGG